MNNMVITGKRVDRYDGVSTMFDAVDEDSSPTHLL
jgi:hypothetical protein